MLPHPLRAAWVEINRSHLAHNLNQIQKKVGPDIPIIGVVKADGYGHGALPVIEVLRKGGVRTFAIATLEEAIRLREKGVKEELILLGLTPDSHASALAEYHLTPLISNLNNGQAIAKAAKKSGIILNAYIAVDTGMGRIGYLPQESTALEEIKKINQLDALKIKGLFSHFATADTRDKTFAHLQEKRLIEFHQQLDAAHIHLKEKTMANSAAIMDLPSSFFDAVRPGIILYGCYPSEQVNKKALDLKPVMSVKARILHLKDVPIGFSVSYGQTFVTRRPSRIATIGLGYADGYPRPYSSQGKVLINGVTAPLAGTICMDQCMIDVTDVPRAKPGDEVIAMGSDGNHTISADYIAQATDTINYEIVCALGQRLPKVYVD